jgi:hypothetical protein
MPYTFQRLDTIALALDDANANGAAHLVEARSISQEENLKLFDFNVRH